MKIEGLEDFRNLGFEIEITGDGSPTLRQLFKDPGETEVRGECMHHSGGALAETDLIYGDLIRDRLEYWEAQKGNAGLEPEKPRFLVVGLGLGFIELLIALECLRVGARPDQIHITSFEFSKGLIDLFKKWIHSDHPSTIYDQILSQMVQNLREKNGVLIPETHVRDFLARAMDCSSFEMKGALEDVPPQERRLHDCILYDAFSAKTTPKLWEESFLNEFFETWVSPQKAYFATYACRGSLKRALRSSQFFTEIKPGFMGKRNSTRATR